ncbi:MAG: 30S ribosome-binding factor RbfA [Hyphomicrobium aestuarii]|nr:30S ribosome-binding factor RbfA [Hyphomicrobium aestuarii]
MSRSKSKTGAAAGAPSQRMLRVAEVIRHELSALLSRGDIHDDTLSGAVITIPEVRMSPDLKLATVYVMPLGGDKVDDVIAALETHKRFIRGALAKSVNLKFAPDVRFRRDETFEEASRIAKLLDTGKPLPPGDT